MRRRKIDNSLHVLLVDDQPVLSTLLSEYLEKVLRKFLQCLVAMCPSKPHAMS